jgi:hypothetical protein
LVEEEDCSISSFDDNDDDEYDYEEHIKLQKRHEYLLYSHKEFIDSYTLLESTHEVMVTKVKDSQPLTCTCVPPSIYLSCANSCCFQAKSSCDEHVLVETCDSFIASENDELKRENEMLKMELSRLKDKCHVQLSQDNRDHIVKKLEKGSTVICVKLLQINLKTSYQKFDNPKIKKKAHVKRFECSTLGHFPSECPNERNDQTKPSRRQRSLSQRRYFGCKEKGHNIADCSKEKVSKQVYQNRAVQFGKSEYPVLAKNFRTSGQCNKGFKLALDKHISKNESTKRQSNNKASRIKHQTCYICCDKSHLSMDCPKTQSFINKVVKANISHLGPKNDICTIKVIGIWVLKHLLTNHEGPNKTWVPKLA